MKVLCGFEDFWTEQGYRSGDVSEPDERANALAVLSGLADETKYDVIADIFERSFHATPLLEYYVESACMELGRADLAETRMKRQYADMIIGENAEKTSTLWEYWAYGQGTQNHAWSGGPLVILSRDFAGVRPISPGYESFLIKPRMGSLTSISCTVPTPQGEIVIGLSRDDVAGTFRMELTKPEGEAAVIAVPRYWDEMTVTLDGANITEFADEDEGYFYLEIPAEWTETEVTAE